MLLRWSGPRSDATLASVVWFGVRTLGRRRLGALAILVALTAALVGFVFGAANAARRSSTSFDRLLATGAGPDLLAFVTPPDVDGVVADLRAHRDVASVGAFSWVPFSPSGGAGPIGTFTAVGSGFGTSVLRSEILEGRAPRQDRADEVTVNEAMADAGHFHVGQRIHLRADLGTDGGPADQAVTIVGIHLNALDVGPNASQPSTIATTAFGARWLPELRAVPGFDSVRLAVAVRVRHGASIAGLEKDIKAAHPDVGTATDAIEGDITSGLRVESTALWLLCAVAAVTSVATLAFLATRVLQRFDLDGDVLNALGATRRQRTLLVGAPAVLAVLVGIGLAAPVAWATSAWVHPSLARKADPARQAWVDGRLLAAGVAIAMLTLVAMVLVAARAGISQSRQRSPRPRTGRSRLLTMSPTIAVGVVAAVASHDLRARRLARSAVIGGGVAIACVAGAMTWIVSDAHLQRDLALQGWTFDAAAEAGPGTSEDTVTEIEGRLRRSADVAALDRYERLQLAIGGSDVDIYSYEALRSSVELSVTDGRLAGGNNEVVAGPATLRRLGKRVGDDLVVTGEHGKRRLTIVGEAVLPYLGNGTFGDNIAVAPATLDRLVDAPLATGYLIRLRPGASLHQLKTMLGADMQFTTPYAAPPIQHVRDAESIARILAMFFAALALVVFLAAVLGAGRRRRQDFAILRALGFRRRQVVGAAAVQVLVLAGIAYVVGTPVGVGIGRSVWRITQRSLFVVDATSVPWVGLAVAAAAAAATAIVGALALAWSPSRRPAGDFLRAP